MSLKQMTKEELELLSYTDLTNLLLKENGKSMNTADLFKEICNLLEYDFESHMDKIGDYYTSLNSDKRFVILDNREWDLRERHAINITIDDDEDEEELELSEDDEESEEELIEEEELEEPIEDEDDLDDDDSDIDGLAVVEEEEEL